MPDAAKTQDDPPLLTGTLVHFPAYNVHKQHCNAHKLIFFKKLSYKNIQF